MDFVEVIDEKIKLLKTRRSNAEQNIGDIGVYAGVLASQLQEVEQQVIDLDDEPTTIKNEFISVLRQVPGSLIKIDAQVKEECKRLDNDISMYEEMKKMYAEWAVSQLEEPEPAPEPEPEPVAPSAEGLKAGILSGEIPEPNKFTAMRRKSGTRPQMTLRQYRKILSGEDSSE